MKIPRKMNQDARCSISLCDYFVSSLGVMNIPKGFAEAYVKLALQDFQINENEPLAEVPIDIRNQVWDRVQWIKATFEQNQASMSEILKRS